MLLKNYATFYSDTNVECIVVIKLIVFQIEALREDSQLKTLTVDVDIEIDEVVQEPPDSGFSKSTPSVVALFVFAQDLELKEMLVCFKERELFEQAPPSDGTVFSVLSQFFCYHCSFFELCQQNMLG